MQEIGRRKFPNLTTPPSLRMPGHVYAHGNVVLDGNCQKRRWIDLEIGERGRNGPADMRLAALFFHFERHLFIVGSLASELNLKVGIDVDAAASDSGKRVRTVTSGNSAPRVT